MTSLVSRCELADRRQEEEVGDGSQRQGRDRPA